MFDSIAALSRHFPELPDLPTNKPYRNAVELIRSSHEHNFLPLKIIDYDSYLYTELIQAYLYKKCDHMAYLRRMWKSA
jgi:hypothetical protein